MSDKVTAPVNLAVTGPIFTAAVARKSVSLFFSNAAHPGMKAARISSSFKASHTVCLSAGSVYSPDMVIAMSALPFCLLGAGV